MTQEEKLLLALLGAMAPKKKTFIDHVDTVVDKCEDAITSIPDKCSNVADKVEDAVDNIVDFFTI
jgi:hypothetical protein